MGIFGEFGIPRSVHRLHLSVNERGVAGDIDCDNDSNLLDILGEPGSQLPSQQLAYSRVPLGPYRLSLLSYIALVFSYRHTAQLLQCLCAAAYQALVIRLLTAHIAETAMQLGTTRFDYFPPLSPLSECLYLAI